MKMLVESINRVKRSGKSQKGNDYNIDVTEIVVKVPYDNLDGFGSKFINYPYGKSENFEKLQSLRGKLPLELDIELGTELNQYDQPVTVVIDIKLPQKVTGASV